MKLPFEVDQPGVHLLQSLAVARLAGINEDGLRVPMVNQGFAEGRQKIEGGVRGIGPTTEQACADAVVAVAFAQSWPTISVEP